MHVLQFFPFVIFVLVSLWWMQRGVQVRAHAAARVNVSVLLQNALVKGNGIGLKLTPAPPLHDRKVPKFLSTQWRDVVL